MPGNNINILEQPFNTKRKTGDSGEKGAGGGALRSRNAKKKRLVKDQQQRVLPLPQVALVVPESQTYCDLQAFENKLDSTIMCRRLDIQEALKRPVKQKHLLRFYISSGLLVPQLPKLDETEWGEFGPTIPEWELKIEGRLLDMSGKDTLLHKRHFSSFFKNIVIELDKDLYGPDNHLIEWLKTSSLSSRKETDGFVVKRPLIGKSDTKCTIFFQLDYQPAQFKLSGPLSRVLGIHTQTRAVIVNALWSYIKLNKLQDQDQREYVNNDTYLKEIFETERMKVTEIPKRLQAHLLPPDPVIIEYMIETSNVKNKKTLYCYDVTLELDDSLQDILHSFLLSTNSQQELASLETRSREIVDVIDQLRVRKDFFGTFANDPEKFMNDWLTTQSVSLKTMSDTAGNSEKERSSEFYNQSWAEEAVHKYFYRQIQVKRKELEVALGINTST